MTTVRGGKAAADETAGDEEAVTEPEDETARGEMAASEDETRQGWRRRQAARQEAAQGRERRPDSPEARRDETAETRNVGTRH
jgi:hypothetical protein